MKNQTIKELLDLRTETGLIDYDESAINIIVKNLKDSAKNIIAEKEAAVVTAQSVVITYQEALVNAGDQKNRVTALTNLMKGHADLVEAKRKVVPYKKAFKALFD